MFHQIIKYTRSWLLIMSLLINSNITQAIQWPTWLSQNNKTILCSFGALLVGMGIGSYIFNKMLQENNKAWTSRYATLSKEKEKFANDNQILTENLTILKGYHTNLLEENNKLFQEHMRLQDDKINSIKRETESVQREINAIKIDENL